MKRNCTVVAIGMLMFWWFEVAYATTTSLTADMTVDNGYKLYLSTDDSKLGTLIGSDDDWYGAEQFTFDLVPGVTQYLHIQADDWGVISGFVGGFSLSSPDYHFANGTQSLTTNAEDWKVSKTGFGSNYEKPTETGKNGVSPWGAFCTIPSNAYWIWTNNGMDTYTTRYFTSPVYYGAGTVPEPATLTLLVLGGAALISSRRRK